MEVLCTQVLCRGCYHRRMAENSVDHGSKQRGRDTLATCQFHSDLMRRDLTGVVPADAFRWILEEHNIDIAILFDVINGPNPFGYEGYPIPARRDEWSSSDKRVRRWVGPNAVRNQPDESNQQFWHAFLTKICGWPELLSTFCQASAGRWSSVGILYRYESCFGHNPPEDTHMLYLEWYEEDIEAKVSL